MALSALINLGIKKTANSTNIKVTITNWVTIITCGLTLFYALYFYAFLAQRDATLINLFFVACYAGTFLLTSCHYYRAAKLWFFSVFICHIIILTTQVFSPAVGFQFYFLILPSGVFLLFDEDESYEKVIICILGIIAFFVCHNYQNEAPLVLLPVEIEKVIFIFSIIIVMLENFIVMSVFSLAISRHQAVLNEMATKDVLTGINNRRTFMLVGEELVAHANRYNKQLSFLLFDIDFFKKINDSYGHLVGDQALRLVARVLRNNLRESDSLARYGGEEFVVLLPETDELAAKELAEKLREAVENLSIPLKGNQENKFFNCTVSIGISSTLSSRNNGDISLNDLVQQADEALYQAKGTGRNCVVKYTSDKAVEFQI
ncbi:MAG: GGDEF domain-containing protein [Colwellia sp.]|nr:GGDEF domain-containing protein [Colwellia sp.]